MRSTLLVLALSIPSWVLAAPTDASAYSSQPASGKGATDQHVQVDFFNSMPTPCELHVGHEVVSVPSYRSVRLHLPVHENVSVTSAYRSHFAKVVLTTAATDHGRTVFLQ